MTLHFSLLRLLRLAVSIDIFMRLNVIRSFYRRRCISKCRRYRHGRCGDDELQYAQHLCKTKGRSPAQPLRVRGWQVNRAISR